MAPVLPMRPLTPQLESSTAASLSNNGYTYAPLGEVRSQLTTLPMVPNDRNATLISVQSLFDIYVHRQVKIDNYGAAYPSIDPIPRLNALIANNAKLTDTEFHYSLSSIFLSQRDFHTNYLIPGPHRCFYFTTAIVFDFVESKDIVKNPGVVVNGFSKIDEILNVAGKSLLKKIGFGDWLVSVDGLSFKQYYEKNQWWTGGAGISGGHRSALTSLEAFSGVLFRPPVNNNIKFTFKSRKTNKEYNVELPWVAARNDSCYNEFNALMKVTSGGHSSTHMDKRDVFTSVAETSAVQGGSNIDAIVPMPMIMPGTVSMPNAMRVVKPTKSFSAPSQGDMPFGRIEQAGPKPFDAKAIQVITRIGGRAKAPHLDSVFDAFSPKTFAAFQIQETEDPSIAWGIYDPSSTNLGVIVLRDFEPLNYDSVLATLRIRDLLVTKLKDTKALVFDIRDNPGGLITLANYLPQLFGKNVKLVGGRLVVSPVNTNIFTLGVYPNDTFTTTYLSTPPDQNYTKPVLFDTEDEAYQVGEAYFKAVGVFTNGNCYSACDMFSANMQDNGIGVVFGEDASTGGGGANVVSLNDFLLPVDPIDFVSLPYALSLSPKRAQDLRVAWRQIVRVGLNAGKLIEDAGVVSDVVVRPSSSDFSGNTRTYKSQWDRIAKHLNTVNKDTCREHLSFECEPLVRDAVVGASFALPANVSGVARLDVLDATHGGINAPVVGKIKLPDSALKKKTGINITTTQAYSQTKFIKFEIRGVSSSDNLVFRTIRYVRFTPLVSDMLVLSSSKPKFNWDFAQQKYVAIYNYALTTDDADGWNIANGALRVGNGVQYANMLNTDTSFFIVTPKPSASDVASSITISIQGKLESELNYDYFGIGYKLPNGQSTLIYTNSGVVNLDLKLTFPNPGGAVEVYLLFQSDSGGTFKGITLTKIQIEIE